MWITPEFPTLSVSCEGEKLHGLPKMLSSHTNRLCFAVVKEKSYVADYYNNRSVAEQNSFDLSWELFMDRTFDDLRTAICATPAELQHFRQLVINSVMATGKFCTL